MVRNCVSNSCIDRYPANGAASILGGWSGLKNCRVLTKPFGSVSTVSFGLRLEGSTREFKTDFYSGTNAVVSLVGGPGFAR